MIEYVKLGFGWICLTIASAFIGIASMASYIAWVAP